MLHPRRQTAPSFGEGGKGGIPGGGTHSLALSLSPGTGTAIERQAGPEAQRRRRRGLVRSPLSLLLLAGLRWPRRRRRDPPPPSLARKSGVVRRGLARAQAQALEEQEQQPRARGARPSAPRAGRPAGMMVSGVARRGAALSSLGEQQLVVAQDWMATGKKLLLLLLRSGEKRPRGREEPRRRPPPGPEDRSPPLCASCPGIGGGGGEMEHKARPDSLQGRGQRERSRLARRRKETRRGRGGWGPLPPHTIGADGDGGGIIEAHLQCFNQSN